MSLLHPGLAAPAGPWTSGLFTLMEGGLRTAFLVHWPGVVPAGRESDEIVHEVDQIHDASARWAGADVPERTAPIDGLDLRDFLERDGQSDWGGRGSRSTSAISSPPSSGATSSILPLASPVDRPRLGAVKPCRCHRG